MFGGFWLQCACSNLKSHSRTWHGFQWHVRIGFIPRSAGQSDHHLRRKEATEKQTLSGTDVCNTSGTCKWFKWWMWQGSVGSTSSCFWQLANMYHLPKPATVGDSCLNMTSTPWSPHAMFILEVSQDWRPSLWPAICFPLWIWPSHPQRSEGWGVEPTRMV